MTLEDLQMLVERRNNGLPPTAKRRSPPYVIPASLVSCATWDNGPWRCAQLVTLDPDGTERTYNIDFEHANIVTSSFYMCRL